MAAKVNKYTNLRFGADPELFLVDTSGKYISAIGRIGGTKSHPRTIDEFGSAVQEDNVAVEFNIAPASSKEEFLVSLHRPLSYIEQEVKKMGLEMAFHPSAIFDNDQLNNPQAQMFGCDVDYNVWTGKPNPRPKASGKLKNLRTCGGHVHVSWDTPTISERSELIRAFDLFLGVPSILIDKDNRRRSLYGKAGAFRPKNYGAEYRVLSNFWVGNSRLAGWVVDQASLAIEFLRAGNSASSRRKEIVDTINTSDTQHAQALCDEFALSTSF